MWTKILNAAYKNTNFEIIKNFDFNKNKANELWLFLKPEVFFTSQNNCLKIIEMVMSKLKTFGVEASGMALLSGNFLAKHEIMDRHYGFINKLSKNASKLITAEDIAKIKTVLAGVEVDESEIFGGHEVLANYLNNDIEALDKFWFSKPSLKVRSGFYVQSFEINGKNVVIINGFHPSQLAHFTNSNNKILVMLTHSDTDWTVLKNDLAGATFPEKAGAESIRGELFRNKESFGIEQVSANRNFVHLSAGAFEAFFEINNFISNFPEMDFSIEKTNVCKQMKNKGFGLEQISNCLSNPFVTINGKQTDLFTATEELNTAKAVEVLNN